MIITDINIDGFKNLNNINITLDPSVNIITGKNAQGKTNIIEAIWILSGVKSFRATKEKDFINFNKENANISINFKNSLRQQNINVTLSKNQLRSKKIEINGIDNKNFSSLFGNLKCMIFTPEDLFLTKGSPKERRNFIDLCISQIKPGYFKVINKYENILNQRNKLLKNISMGISKKSDLEIWDLQLAKIGSYISLLRYNYINKLNVFAQKLYNELSENKEDISLYYKSTIFDTLKDKTDYKNNMANEYMSKIIQNIKEDLKYSYTSVGVHRDDIQIDLNNYSLKEFGSQGQCRSVSIVLKLAAAYILSEECGDSPIILLDDVLSELDESRQKFILTSIKNMQIIITSCNNINLRINNRKIGKNLIVNNGTIID